MLPNTWADEPVQGLHRLRVDVTLTLLFLFLFFVVIDSVATQWLILNSPGGLVNEINPIGVILYNQFGPAGMIFPKFGLFTLFAALTVYFITKHSGISWFVEFLQTLVLTQMAISLIVSFNNFVAILATLYAQGSWPVVKIPLQTAVLGIYVADLGLGATFANGIMYMWGVTKSQLHLKVFVSLMVFITPILLFAEGFRTHLWLFALYVASGSAALGLFFYITERANLTRVAT